MPLAGLAGAAVTAGGGLLSSILGLRSQKSANNTNLKIAQMNNEWSERMMEKQHGYDVEMWNKNNEYNDPSKQVERLKAAGINPALALGNIGTGQASGGNSVGLPSPSRAEVKPLSYEGFANSINNAVQTALQIQKQSAELDALRDSIDFERQKTRVMVAEGYERARSEKFKNELNDITKDMQIAQKKDEWLSTVQRRYTDESVENLNKQLAIGHSLVNQNLPDKLAMEVAVMASQRDLNKHNIKSEADKIIDSMKKRGFNLSKSEEKRIFDAIVSSIELNGVPDSWTNPKALEYGINLFR